MQAVLTGGPGHLCGGGVGPSGFHFATFTLIIHMISWYLSCGALQANRRPQSRRSRQSWRSAAHTLTRIGWRS